VLELTVPEATGLETTALEATGPAHPWVADGAGRTRFAIGPVFLDQWSETLAFIQRAEALGFDACWANDHPNRIMDCWTELAALAVATARIRLISLVSCVYYRSPYLLARQAADVDRLSDGRLVLGIGSGWDAPEFAEMCIPMPPHAIRQQTMEETLQIVQGLWRGQPFTFNGQYRQVEDAVLRVLPVQQPYIPILIAGGGERITLRQVARYADMSNFAPHESAGSAFDVRDVRRKLGRLGEFCAEIGRPYDSIVRSHYSPLLTLAADEDKLAEKKRTARIPDAELHTVPLFATPEQAIAHYQALADAGIQFFLCLVNGRDEETVHLLADVVRPAIRPAPGRPAPLDRGCLSFTIGRSPSCEQGPEGEDRQWRGRDPMREHRPWAHRPRVGRPRAGRRWPGPPPGSPSVRW
jgi:alkanesulfonate monooxygenase SsuD/methylene tetrahydromethanopterin reductase-like flavin-dependent oxidoreductase (luciferase family)